MITSEIGHTTPDRIMVRGHDLSAELLGKVDFIDAFMLCALGRKPSAPEREMTQALLVLALDHGLTPSSIAARLTYLGAPDSLQSAVAAGLLGAGSRYLGPATIVSLRLAQWLDGFDGESDADYERCATKVLADPKHQRLPGFGHPIHKHGDPRVAPLREIARRNGFHGRGWRLFDALAVQIMAASGTTANASGALGATVLDMALPPSFASGIALVGRCAGLVAHILEEQQHPVGQEVWELVMRQDARNDLGRDPT